MPTGRYGAPGPGRRSRARSAWTVLRVGLRRRPGCTPRTCARPGWTATRWAHRRLLGGAARAYESNRAPLFVGNHFEEWNGGIYVDAVEETPKGTPSADQGLNTRPGGVEDPQIGHAKLFT
ncbi:hypothetical protein GCM10010347_49620 [Streptomyces cirratus]|uniref:Uncharacterized protein n=1 Tax=Streptomyces cirratus TaxID=68187 RepID=A0ABQ3F295_9ACTN|nr:hypothetical protein GCM10010347_49620 [Streptomyces cirratus]